jgi:ribonuclease HI
MKLIIYSDGGSRGNPGPAAVGVVVQNDQGQVLKQYGEAIGQATNNEAEYQAAIFALKKIKQVFGKTKMKQAKIQMRLDSELVVKQLNHQYKIEEPGLQPLFLAIWNLMMDFGQVSFSAVPRAKNRAADRLVNQALDEKNNQANLFEVGDC